MSIGTADIQKAVNAAWDASSLNTIFKALWQDPTENYPVLNDQEATPGSPFPYCVMDQPSPTVVTRMSGGVSALREIRDCPLAFNVHAQEVSGDSRTAKEIAAYLVEEIMKVFGGHPTVTPSGTITLDNGKFLIALYDSDYGIRTDEETCQWVLNYTLRVDVPVAV